MQIKTWYVPFHSLTLVQALSQTMKNLVEKAFTLSQKLDMREEVRLIQEEEQKLTKLMRESSQPLDFDPVTAIFQDPNFIDNTNAAQSIKFMDDLMLDPHSSSEKPVYRQLRNPLIQS